MARRGRTPERGGETHAWTFDHCRDAKPREGYCAGPLHWLLCHDSSPTKPCFKPLYTRGANCPYCKSRIPTYEFGYQPLRDKRGRTWVVGIRSTHERVVARISPGQGVRWGRCEGIGEGCYVEPWPVTPDWHYWYPDLKPEADLSPWLVRLWKLPDLLPALRCYFASSDSGVSSAAPEADPVEVPEVDSDPAGMARIEAIAREQRAGRAAKGDPAVIMRPDYTVHTNGKPRE